MQCRAVNVHLPGLLLQPNLRFVEGQIEYLDQAGILDESIDLIISNCVVGCPAGGGSLPACLLAGTVCLVGSRCAVLPACWRGLCGCSCMQAHACALLLLLQINLSPDKAGVLREAWRVLAPGGEMYFSDVYADRRLPAEVSVGIRAAWGCFVAFSEQQRSLLVPGWGLGGLSCRPAPGEAALTRGPLPTGLPWPRRCARTRCCWGNAWGAHSTPRTSSASVGRWASWTHASSPAASLRWVGWWVGMGVVGKAAGRWAFWTRGSSPAASWRWVGWWDGVGWGGMVGKAAGRWAFWTHGSSPAASM